MLIGPPINSQQLMIIPIIFSSVNLMEMVFMIGVYVMIMFPSALFAPLSLGHLKVEREIPSQYQCKFGTI